MKMIRYLGSLCFATDEDGCAVENLFKSVKRDIKCLVGTLAY
jgi:hypothetical protein